MFTNMLWLPIALVFYTAYTQGRNIDRIYGGTNATRGRHPYMAALQLRGVHWCGASIIRINYVLTAAHCIESDLESEFYIMVGSIDQRNGTYHDIEEIKIHGDYHSENGTNDLALAKSATNFVYNRYVRPIAIQRRFEEGNRSVRLTGWGWYNRNFDNTSTFLQQIDMVTMTNDECRETNFAWPITDGNLCTRTTMDHGFCRGDSGGPLVDRRTNEQVGVVSFSSADCAVGYPDIFVRTGYFYNWIMTNAV